MTHLAYLLSEYPAISHTFIFREIQDLERLGFKVQPISVNGPQAWQGISNDELKALEQTPVLKHQGLVKLMLALVTCISKSPLGFARMLAFSVRLCFNGPKSPLKALAYLLEAVLMIPLLRARGIEHVHEHFANPTAFVCLMLKKYGGFSYSLSVHGPDIFHEVEGAMLVEKLQHATFIRSISHFCRSQILRILPQDVWSRVHLIRCGVDPDTYIPKPQTSNTIPKMLCVGRLTSAKGQRVLLDACVRLKLKGLKFELTFVGDGPDRKALVEARHSLGLDTDVKFAGAIGQDDLQNYYDQADLFVLPSFAEGIPVVLMEAMAKMVPVVSTRINGIPELIDDRINGMLVFPSDHKGLADTIRYLLTHPQLRQGLAAQGRLTVKREYNHHKNNEELAKVFRSYGVGQ